MQELSVAKALLASGAAEEKKARDIVVLDLRDISTITDFFVLATGTSRPHLKAIMDAIEERLEESGHRLLHKEGTETSGWILLDYGDVIVHIFGEQEREYYDIERLWRDGKVLTT
ncbi:MAG TPA: ribosome silencing factor [Firmicutes bacterium]|nr:ribosome silencing factor [Bacillota bacterium]